MIAAMFRVMALSVIRDRGSLALAFVLPPVIFIIFAAIFSSASGGDIRLQIAMGAESQTRFAQRLETAIRSDDAVRILPGISTSRDEVVKLVESGRADVGLFVRDNTADTSAAPLTILVDPGKQLAGNMLSGQLQRLIASELPDIALSRTAITVEELAGGFSIEQKVTLDAALNALANDEGASSELGASPLIATEQLGTGSANASTATIAYYAGAVSILFLLFSALQGAATLIEERHAGILDRIAVGPSGTDVVVIGKFLFLTVQGVIQVGLIFLAAALLYGLDVASHIGPWLIITIIASAAAAGLGLAVASACTSKQQAQTVATFVVLVSSAMGGSMVPRFMMPPWLQDIGWFTPNAWAVEAYYGTLWRGEPLADVTPELLLLAATGLIALGVGIVVSRWRLSL